MKHSKLSPPTVSRRAVFGVAAGGACSLLMPIPAIAQADEMQQAIANTFATRPIQEGRVSVTMPPIAENGYTVPVEIEVDSQMSDENHVTRISLFSERNPIPTIIHFELGPRAGLARVSTRVRLAGTQSLTAIAEMSDGTLWSGSARTLVTLAACVVM